MGTDTYHNTPAKINWNQSNKSGLSLLIISAKNYEITFITETK